MRHIVNILLTVSVLLPAIHPLSAQQKKPVAFYLENLPGERIGEYSDERIISDLQDDGFVVIEVDCSRYPQTSPELENALVEFHKNSPEVYSKYETADIEIDPDYIFYVPEGYTITRNIPVWNIEENGADGSVERVMDTYNSVIVPKFGVEPVTDPEQMKNPDGSDIDWNLYIDIIHPSGNASKDVPLLLNFSSNSPRMVPFSPLKTEEVVYRSIFPMGFMTTGYAWANADHCYNPLARGESWGYFDQYTLEDWDGLAAVTAYVRYLRTHLQDYNLDGKIGVMGISKASYSAVRIADLNNADGEEHFLFNGTPNNKPQPWQDGESHVDVAYAAAGNGTRRVSQYVNGNTVPMITSAGAKDEYNQWAVYPEVVRHMQDIDHIHLALWMEELGHTYPGMGTDLATGEPRYVIFKRFFDHYLKPDSEHDADVFYIIPKEGAAEIDSKGYSRVLAPDGILPVAMLGISPYSPITVRFLTEFSEDEINAKVKIVKLSDGSSVKGVWTASMQNTSFSFTPETPLEKDEEYEISVPDDLTSLNGNSPSAAKTRKFKVTNVSDEDEGPVVENKIFPTDDTYSQVAKNTEPKGDEKTLRVRYSTMGDWRFDGFMKFDISDLKPGRITKASIYLTPSAALTGTPITIQFFKTNPDWSEDGLVSESRPLIEDSYFDAQTVSVEGNTVIADATNIIRQTLMNGEKEFSICIRVPSSAGSTENIYFNSKEAEQEAVRPFLSVEKTKITGNPTIDIEREYEAGETVILDVRTEYEDETVSVEWFMDDNPVEGDTITPDSGLHKIKAVVTGPPDIGTDIIVKYIKVN